MQPRLKAGFLSFLLALIAALGLILAGSASLHITISPSAAGAEPSVIPAASYTPLPALQFSGGTPAVDNAPQADLSAAHSTAARIAATANPAVVGIVEWPTESPATSPDRDASGAPDQDLLGSGFVIDAQGHICTGRDVLGDRDDLGVVLVDGTRLRASVVGTDRATGLAVLKVNAAVPGVATFANSDAVHVGQDVAALASGTGSAGVVSAGKVIGMGTEPGAGRVQPDLIRIDAIPPPAGKGGPLVDSAGRVLGLVVGPGTATGAGSTNTASTAVICGNVVKQAADQIIKSRSEAPPYLGISYMPVTPGIARFYHLPSETGVWVSDVTPGGPAARAGIRPNSAITHFEGTLLNSNTALVGLLLKHHAGDPVTVRVIAPGTMTEKDVIVVLGGRPADH